MASILRLALLALALGTVACGSGNDCAGFISINATPASCEQLAQQFGCSDFTVDGPNCGLTACATCDGI